MDIIRTAIIPSITYAFPVAPCSENDLAGWDRLALITIKERYKLQQYTATAILREDKINFGLGCFPSPKLPGQLVRPCPLS
eukprot:684187-Pelagomonas_calceolata.AAC.1